MRLIFSDGTVVENGQAGYSSGFLWLRLPGFTMQEAASYAFDIKRTERIEFHYGEMQDDYEGYTHCTRIMEDENEISVCMVKG